MDAWQRISELFRTAYATAAEEHAATWRPVLEVHADRCLLLRTADGDREFRWEPDAAEADLRRLSHVPLLVYLVTKAPDGHAQQTRELAGAVDEMLDTLAARGLTGEQQARNRRLLDAVKSLIHRFGSLDPLTTADAAALADELRPVIDANLADAARLNLDALANAVAGVLDVLGDDELERLVVLNRGNKSARIGNQVDLYLRSVLGDDASDERLVFAEGANDIAAAREVLGKYLLDRAIGDDFFGDPLTLRTDVLSSPTREELERRIEDGSIPRRRPGRAAPDGRGG